MAKGQFVLRMSKRVDNEPVDQKDTWLIEPSKMPDGNLDEPS